VGVEALLRWHPPGAEIRAPGDFLPLVEQSRLIHPLFEWVFVTALRAARAWNVDGRVLPISVNLSARNLLDPALAETVTRLLGTERATSSWIKFEITESMLMLDVGRAGATLRRLRDMGFNLSIDDFGTGYSSMSYLQQLPVEELKIDRSFVSRAVVDAGSLAIVRATIELAHGLGLRVVAEGVEDNATWSALSELGCDLGQGYLFGHPVPGNVLDPERVMSLR
jgi:diguanylate cyclase